MATRPSAVRNAVTARTSLNCLWFEDYDIREQMTEIQQTVELIHTDMGYEFEKLRSQYLANNFLNTMKAMANEAKNGPRLFTR